MDFLPNDPAMMVSYINMLLRDGEFDSLRSLCYNFDRKPSDVISHLRANGYEYSEEQKQFRPIGFDKQGEADARIPLDSIETAFAFFDQKRRVYVHSSIQSQRDDIEYAIGEYADAMNQQLYRAIAGGRSDFLRDHTQFEADITHAVDELRHMIEQRQKEK